MVLASVDCVAHLPAPPNKANYGVCELAEGQLLAYASQTTVNIFDVPSFQFTTFLLGGHQAAVTALKWFPEQSGMHMLKSSLRLASGDAEGKVVVWDIQTAEAIACLEDPWLAATGRRQEASQKSEGVRALAWILSAPSLLAVVLPNMLLVWNPTGAGGGVIWKRDISMDSLFSSIQVDPSDRRRICLCGERGSLMVMHLLDLEKDRTQQQTYKVDVTASKAAQIIRCAFSACSDLLYILLARELIVFDLEFGQPAATSSLGTSRPPFRDMLGCYGSTAKTQSIYQPGIDSMFCSHQNGSISLWRRKDDSLTYSLSFIHPLLPPPSRINNNHVLSYTCFCAAMWKICTPAQRRTPLLHEKHHLNPTTDTEMKTAGAGKALSTADPKGSLDCEDVEERDCSPSLLAVCISDDGQIWQWDVPISGQAAGRELPSAILTLSPQKKHVSLSRHLPISCAPCNNGSSFMPGSPQDQLPPPSKQHHSRPQLLGLLHSLPSPVATISMSAGVMTVGSGPECLSDEAIRKECCTGLLAAATLGGNVEIVSFSRGPIMPLKASVSMSLGLHKDVVRGVRWLGGTPLIASFSSEKLAGGFCNTLLLTNVYSRSSTPFRPVASEASSMLGIRASPSGRYLLLLFRAAPSEIWLVRAGQPPARMRVLDLPFTAVEWIMPKDSANRAEPLKPPSSVNRQTPTTAQEPHQPRSRDETTEASTLADVEEPPEERLAFSLSDGRVGVLSIVGRKVTDTKPKRPFWGPTGIQPDSVCTALAAWGHLVILGNDDGLLSLWDTITGRTTSLDTEQTPLSPASSSRYGKIVDISWTPLPSPIGSGTILGLANEGGGLTFVDTVQVFDDFPQKQRMGVLRGLAAGLLSGQEEPLMAPAPPLGSCLLMPRPWTTLLRLIIQLGIPANTLKLLISSQKSLRNSAEPVEMSALSTEVDSPAPEAELWQRFPAGLRQAWNKNAKRDPALACKEMSSLAWDKDLRAVLRSQAASGPFPSDESHQAASAGDETMTQARSSLSPRISLSIERQTSSGGASGAEAHTQGLQTATRRSAVGALRAGVSRMGAAATAWKEAIAISPTAGDTTESQDGVTSSKQSAFLSTTLQCMASMRAEGQLLYPHEWAAYQEALQAKSITQRMAVAADIAGTKAEAAFWKALPLTLATLRESLPQSFSHPAPSLVLYKDPESGISAYRRASEDISSESGIRTEDSLNRDSARKQDGQAVAETAEPAAAPPMEGELWSEAVQLQEARERAIWHEKMSRQSIEQSESLQERRVLEYITLGDYQTAVGFLLASPPERSSRFYRDALCTISLAAASTEAFQPSTPGIPEPVSRTLHIQVAKVVTAHAASVGDTLLGIPLLCSAGLPMEAVNVLQDNGLWRYAATLAAHALKRDEQSAALDRWAVQIHQAEGDLWKALGILTAAGALRNAVLLLRKLKLPDLVAAYVEAATAAGFGSQSVSSELGGLENWHHTKPHRTPTSTQETIPETGNSVNVATEFEEACLAMLQSL